MAVVWYAHADLNDGYLVWIVIHTIGAWNVQPLRIQTDEERFFIQPDLIKDLDDDAAIGGDRCVDVVMVELDIDDVCQC